MFSSLALACVFAWAPTPNPDGPSSVPKGKLVRAEVLGLVGTATFLASYGLTTLLASLQMDNARTRRQFERAAPMAIPIAGPFVRIGAADHPLPRLTSATTQALGAGLMLAGITTRLHDGPAPRGVARSRKIGETMVWAGSGTFALAYLLSAAGGGGHLDEPEDENQRAFGRRMLIPVVGGFLAMPKARSYFGMWVAGVAGGLQLTGVTLLAAGVGIRRRAKRSEHLPAVWATPTRSGMHVSLAMRF